MTIYLAWAYAKFLSMLCIKFNTYLNYIVWVAGQLRVQIG